MAWHPIGDKPLSEPTLTQFTDIYVALGGDELRGEMVAYLQHYISMIFLNNSGHKGLMNPVVAIKD